MTDHRKPWNTVDKHVRHELARRCTQKQLDVFILWHAGCGYERIGDMLNLSPRSVRTHLRRAKAHYYALTILEPDKETA